MRTYLLFFLTTIIALNSIAQLTQGINFQAVARDNNNNIVTEQTISIRITIIKENILGEAVYSETHQIASDLNGIISLIIGQGMTSDDFQMINWGEASHFLKTEMDIEGGSDFVEMGTIQFATVPYAKYAESAGNIDISLSEIVIKGNDVGGEQLKNIANPTDDQDAVTKAYLDLLIIRINSLEIEVEDLNTIVDNDGNKYKTYKVGNQRWMGSNLKTTSLNDGTQIPFITNNTEWSNMSTPAYYWNDNTKDISGALYNWYTVETKRLCPVGWRVPTPEDWSVLKEYLGGDPFAGIKLKEEGTTHWLNFEYQISSVTTGNVSDDVTNETGFSALPGGAMGNRVGGGLEGVGEAGLWWTNAGSGRDRLVSLIYQSNQFTLFLRAINTAGYSVRCLKN